MSSRTDSLKPVKASKSRASFGAYAVPVVPRHNSSSEPAAQSDQGKATSGNSIGSPQASSAALKSSGRSSSRAALGLRHSANAQLPPLKAHARPEEAAAGEAGSAVRQTSQAGPRSSTPEAVQAAPQPSAVETAAALEHCRLQQTSPMDLKLEGAGPESLVAAADVETPLPGAVEQEPEPVRGAAYDPAASCLLEEPDPAQAAEGRAAPAQPRPQDAEPVLAAADTAMPTSEARGLQDPEAGLHTAAMADLQEPGPQTDQAGAGGEAAGSEGSAPPGSEPEESEAEEAEPEEAEPEESELEESEPEESEPEDSDEGDEADDPSEKGGAAPPPSGLMGLIALLEARQAAPPAPAQPAHEQQAEGAGPQLARQQDELGSYMDDDDHNDYDEEDDEEEHINSLADALLDMWNQTHANESEATSRCGEQLPALSRLPDWPLHNMAGTSI